ncbi:helix-turn-helix transcriptional regulator [Aquimarina sp. 2304DJ70-9]|uniref:helix-turn-helix transcriptional regulator n=1 Tax=Aquimarina penaris TaxID=3231044 RepID=UPI00346207C7
MMNMWSNDLLWSILFLNASAILYALVSIGIIVIVFFSWKNFQNRMQLNQMAQEKKTLIEKLKAKEEEVKSLMADNSMRLAFKEEWLAKLKNEVLASADTAELRQSLNSLTAQLRLQIDTENKLAGLQERIDHNDIHFDSKLQELYPDLTKGEREVCALLRLNLTIKEIMIVRNVSSDSVKSMRRRIRKKMNIPSEIELEKFIQELA